MQRRHQQYDGAGQSGDEHHDAVHHGGRHALGGAQSGHAMTFLIAARAAGSVASTVRMLPLAVLVLLAAGVPTNIAGWGPREGVAAWVFGVAGLGAAQGVATSVVYGVMVLVASLPGAVVLLVASLHRDPPARGAEDPRRWRPTATACPEGAAGG